MRHWPRMSAPIAAALRGRPDLSPSAWDWLGGAIIAAALALLVIVAHLRRPPGPGTPD